MIRVKRSPQPNVLNKNAPRWLAEFKSLSTDSTATPKQIQNAQNKYRHPKVKDALIKMFCGKCAYCESKIAVVTYGAIDHFFPKSKYPHLTFEWTNLLLSCDRCNDGGHKGTQFPLDGNGNPLLIDPTDGITDPNKHLEFSWDAISGLASVYGRDRRGKTVETVFDLNGIRGRSELIDHRSKYVKRLFALLRFAQQGDAEAITLLKESCDLSAEYSAFALIHIRPHLPRS
ncbi:MAG: HNH endonuclease [Cyanobacteriota bacterium]|nr:HNH endonuclease [Cyanobacteriota bacterium]